MGMDFDYSINRVFPFDNTTWTAPIQFNSIHAIHSRIFLYTAIATCMALELPHSNFLHHILCIPFILSIFNSQKSSLYPTIMLAIMLLNISTIFDLPHTEPRQPLELTCIEINPRAHKAMLH